MTETAVQAPDICVYHDNCDDGFGAAYAVWKRWGDAVTFTPAQYGKGRPPDVENSDILIVDFSYSGGELKDLAARGNRVIVLDHHKTAHAALLDMPRCRYINDVTSRVSAESAEHVAYGEVGVHFDMRKSGCRLAWEYCNAGQSRDMPIWLEMIERRDLGDFKTLDVRRITFAIRSYERDFKVWDRFSATALEKDGRPIMRAMLRRVEDLCATYTIAEIGGFPVPVVVCPYEFASDVGNRLLELHKTAPFAACFVLAHDGITVSLRSEQRRQDVSVIAQRFGGGGHRNAAGFRCRQNELGGLLESITLGLQV